MTAKYRTLLEPWARRCIITEAHSGGCWLDKLPQYYITLYTQVTRISIQRLVDPAEHSKSVESIVYVDESSKNDSISEINKSIEPLDGMNDLLVTKGVTLDNSNKLSKTRERVPKFIHRTPLINLDDYELRPMMMMIMMKMKTETRSMCLRQNKREKGQHGRKKKETNIPPPPPVDSSGCDSGGTNLNVAQVQVTVEAAGGRRSGSTRVVNERVHPIWFTLVACDKQEVNKSSSYIKKYLAQKLSLQSEDEVEHMLGMPIRPDLPLKHLEKLWLRIEPHSG
ncbi:hypothetical protein KY285_026297 [Solanum tuberosum]|nr:hypothetical protein KY285_026297 [Solanum tuberosum]